MVAWKEDLLGSLGFKSCSDGLQFVLKMQVTYLVDLFSHLQIVILNVYLRNVLEEKEMLLEVEEMAVIINN